MDTNLSNYQLVDNGIIEDVMGGCFISELIEDTSLNVPMDADAFIWYVSKKKQEVDNKMVFEDDNKPVSCLAILNENRIFYGDCVTYERQCYDDDCVIENVWQEVNNS